MLKWPRYYGASRQRKMKKHAQIDDTAASFKGFVDKNAMHVTNERKLEFKFTLIQEFKQTS